MVYGAGEHCYELVEGWTKLPEGWSLRDVGGIFIDSADRVFVTNRGGAHLVTVFDPTGCVLTSWGDGSLKKPHGVCVSPLGEVFCTDEGSHTVWKFGQDGRPSLTLGNRDQPSDTGHLPRAGTREERIGSIRRGGPPFNRPTGVALSASGEIYVSDGYGNARVHRFASNGELLQSWGQPGTLPGQFRVPHGVFVDSQQRVWVADRENSRIQVFGPEGQFLAQWTDVKRPQSIWIDDEETVYVAEAEQRISVFARDGTLLARWGNEGVETAYALFTAPHAVAVDKRGDLYVGEVAMSRLGIDRGPRSLQKFRRRR